jgi:hypothetical protein
MKQINYGSVWKFNHSYDIVSTEKYNGGTVIQFQNNFKLKLIEKMQKTIKLLIENAIH